MKCTTVVDSIKMICMPITSHLIWLQSIFLTLCIACRLMPRFPLRQAAEKYMKEGALSLMSELDTEQAWQSVQDWSLPEHDELKDAQEFATCVLVNYQMMSTLVSFVVWLCHNQFFCDCAHGSMVMVITASKKWHLYLNVCVLPRWRQTESGMLVRANLVAAKLSPVLLRN